MTQEKICMLIAMGVYMAAVLVIGIICAKRNKTADDFYLGGRKLNPLVLSLIHISLHVPFHLFHRILRISRAILKLSLIHICTAHPVRPAPDRPDTPFSYRPHKG